MGTVKMSVLPEEDERALNHVSDNKVRKRRANMEPSEHNLCLYQANYFEIKSIQLNKYFFPSVKTVPRI